MSGDKLAKLTVEFQWHCDRTANLPAECDILRWASAAIAAVDAASEVTIRVVDREKMKNANKEWRKQNKATNILSFPADFPSQTGINYLGDLLICADVLLEESQLQEKSLHAHWAHIVVHGMLHLQGFDHIDTQQASEMESREVEILATFGYNNPYQHPLESKQS